MHLEGWFGNYFISLATQLPVIIIYFVGLILAFIWRQRHPKASLFAILGIALLLLNVLLMTGVQLWVSAYWVSGRSSSWNANSLIYAIIVLRSLIGAAGFGFLFMAVFTGRSVNQGSQ
jgi:hypothetical protein